jgi:elongation factor 1 alpha-like protein
MGVVRLYASHVDKRVVGGGLVSLDAYFVLAFDIPTDIICKFFSRCFCSNRVTVSAYPMNRTTTAPCSIPFSAADFFRDAPWLDIPPERRADILVEPLYPRLGLKGGALHTEGKMSKLAALAAARKKKDSERSDAPRQDELSKSQSTDQKPSTLSLMERLSISNGKESRTSERRSGLSAFSRDNRVAGRATRTKTAASMETPRQTEPASTKESPSEEHSANGHEAKGSEPAFNLRAPPSTFASTIVGDGRRPSSLEHSHLVGTNFDVLDVYGQDHAEAFDFTGPSPDDVILNAQSASKGLPIRGMR